MIDKLKCKFDNLISQPYGFNYEIKDQQLHLFKKALNDENNAVEIVKDNRNLLDKTENQKLSRDDIEKMKTAEDMSGNEIIGKLIENSASFQNKTQYSQEKYIKKKKDKYLPIYQIMRPTIRTLCEFYTQGINKRKILNMRMDTISQMLTYSNLAAHRNVMVLESCKGLILSAVVERVGGYGIIFLSYFMKKSYFV
jgi:tRNA (adenine-N(1)-)-methyltransferase non-catalytic subunit